MSSFYGGGSMLRLVIENNGGGNCCCCGGGSSSNPDNPGTPGGTLNYEELENKPIMKIPEEGLDLSNEETYESLQTYIYVGPGEIIWPDGVKDNVNEGETVYVLPDAVYEFATLNGDLCCGTYNKLTEEYTEINLVDLVRKQEMNKWSSIESHIPN